MKNFLTKRTEKARELAKAFCVNHTGKMSSVISISTSVVLNVFCQARAKDPTSICSHCFAASMLEYYTELGKKLARNTELLTTELLNWNDVPVINYEKFRKLRFESFGDLNNAVQVYNYFLIARVNKNMKCALWTKNPHIIAEAMEQYNITKPKNLVIVYSSPKLNEVASDILKRYPFIDKVFTVFDKEHAETVNINCGARDCETCGRCYTKRTSAFVNELLK